MKKTLVTFAATLLALTIYVAPSYAGGCGGEADKPTKKVAKVTKKTVKPAKKITKAKKPTAKSSKKTKKIAKNP